MKRLRFTALQEGRPDGNRAEYSDSGTAACSAACPSPQRWRCRWKQVEKASGKTWVEAKAADDAAGERRLAPPWRRDAAQ